MDTHQVDVVALARKKLDEARRTHLLAVQLALSVGVCPHEISQDVFGFWSATRQLVELATGARV